MPNMERRNAMTLELTDKEMEVLLTLAKEADMTKAAVMRQALRMYQLIVTRHNAGERIMFSGDPNREIHFVGLGFDFELKRPS